jgi:hypothetical protein
LSGQALPPASIVKTSAVRLMVSPGRISNGMSRLSSTLPLTEVM